MKKILKLFDESKTLQIILDKCIIGIFILLAAFLINKNLETAKTKNKIAELSVSRFIDATNDIWKKIGEVRKDIRHHRGATKLRVSHFSKSLCIRYPQSAA